MQLIQAFLRSAAYERRFLSKNHWDLAMLTLIPLLTLLMIWWIFSQTQITDLPIGVIDEDNSAVANTLVRYLEASPNITVRHRYYSPSTAKAAILQREVYGIVTIPKDFSKNITAGLSAPIVLQVNAQYGTHSGIIQTNVQSVAGTLSAGVEIQRLSKQGLAPAQAAIASAPIGIQRISLFNSATDYQQFLASTVIPALLHILAMVIGATTIGRELRDKQLGRWYHFIQANPSQLRLIDNEYAALSSVDNAVNKDRTQSLSAPQQFHTLTLLFALLGKYFWPLLTYSIWSALGLWLATHQYLIAPSALLITYISLVLLMMLSFCLGAIFTLGSFSLRAGLSAAGFISAPSYAFAGVTFPYIAIKDSAKYWADALPLTHYLKLHIAQLQMQAPVAISLPILYGLMLATIIAISITTLLTQYALAHPERWGAR